MGKDVESQIKEVGDHYQKYDADWIMKPGERKKVVEYLLYGYSATDICDAITGMFLSEFHSGKNRDNAVWTGFHYVFREHNFDKFRQLAAAAGQAARLKSERQERKEEEERRRNMERKDMASRHLAGFRYVNEAKKSMGKGSSGGMEE